MRPSSLFQATVLAAVALGFSVATTAQSPLCCPAAPPWASNNGGTAGGVVMFDLTVNVGVLVSQIDVNVSATAGTAVSLELYTTPGSYVGNETNAAAWTLVASDAGGVTAAGNDAATVFPLASTLNLVSGNYGFGVRVISAGQRYTGTGAGASVTVSNNELSLTTGAAISGLFTGSLFSVRSWNGCMHYVPASGQYPNFDATPTSGASPLAVQFTDTTFTSAAGGITQWAWDFDNDGNIDSTVQSPSHTYTAGGKYSVSLTVTDGTFGTNSITKTDLIDVDPITVDFTATPTTGAAPLSVQFTDTSVGNANAWLWDFDNDGVVDSGLQNPNHIYTAPGVYTVTLMASNGVNQGTETKVDLVTVIGATNNTRSAEVLEYQFNEARGTRVNNSASTNLAPLSSTVAQTNGTPVAQAWQADPGRAGFGGNEPGFGVLDVDSASPYEHRVDTGWPTVISGSHTIMFWANIPTSLTTSYAFGTTSGSGRCYYTGSIASWSLRSWISTSSADYVISGTDPGTLSGWNHWAVVLDDTTGNAQWYLNGVADGAPTLFTPGTLNINKGNFIIGGYSTSTSLVTRYMQMDDFRLYTRALTPTDLMAAMAGENPTTSTFDDGCSGPSMVPTIGASGGAPTVGNAGFMIDAANMELGTPQVVNVDLFLQSAGLPYDLGALLPTFTGCFATLYPVVGVGLPGGMSGQFNLPIPNDPSLDGAHCYAQVIVLGSTGAVSPTLDINLRQ